MVGGRWRQDASPAFGGIEPFEDKNRTKGESFLPFRTGNNNAPHSFSMDTTSFFIRIPPHEIAYLNFVFESYEGVAAIRTVDPREGIVELMASPHYQEEIREILKDLAEEFPVQEIVNK